MDEMNERLINFAYILELVLAIFIIIGVMIGFIDVIKQIIEFLRADVTISYGIFKDFLSYVLLLVVGIEFVLMLLTHSVNRTAELIVFVISRKLLIYGSTMLDMVLGALAMALVFATLKFLLPGEAPYFGKQTRE